MRAADTRIPEMLNKVPEITLIFWLIKVLSTTVGETGADYLAVIFAVWYAVERTLSIHTIVTFRREQFYWWAVLFTFALGTAAGDLATEALGLGFNLGVIAFGALIALVAAAYALGPNCSAGCAISPSGCAGARSRGRVWHPG